MIVQLATDAYSNDEAG